MPLCKYAKLKDEEVLNIISEHSHFKYSWCTVHQVSLILFFFFFKSKVYFFLLHSRFSGRKWAGHWARVRTLKEQSSPSCCMNGAGWQHCCLLFCILHMGVYSPLGPGRDREECSSFGCQGFLCGFRSIFDWQHTNIVRWNYESVFYCNALNL